MSEAIFISYRRGDVAGHARSLRRDLAEYFDPDTVFFDQASVEEGAVFTQQLREVITDCKVVLALIGPGWASAAHPDGRLRLDDADDAVRNEIALALSLGKPVIPVAFDNAPVPEAAKLPRDIRPLVEIDFFNLRGKDIDYDETLERLVGRLASVNGVPPPRFRPSRRGGARAGTIAPRDLPYLCDRSRQEAALRQIIRAHLRLPAPKPLVLIVHGQADEAHFAYVERLENHTLPNLLRADGVTGAVKFRKFVRRLPDRGPQEHFDSDLRDQIAANWVPPFDDDARLIHHVHDQKLGGLAVMVGWRESEVHGDFGPPLERLFDYWARFPQQDKIRLLMCIVCLKYEPPSSLWQKAARLLQRKPQARSTVARALVPCRHDRRFTVRVLPKLTSVTVSDLDAWGNVAAPHIAYTKRTETSFKQILGGKASAPMDDVIERLDDLVGG